MPGLYRSLRNGERTGGPARGSTEKLKVYCGELERRVSSEFRVVYHLEEQLLLLCVENCIYIGQVVESASGNLLYIYIFSLPPKVSAFRLFLLNAQQQTAIFEAATVLHPPTMPS